MKMVEFTCASPEDGWEHEHSAPRGDSLGEVNGEKVSWLGWLIVSMRALFDIWSNIAFDSEVDRMWASSLDKDDLVYVP